MIDLGATETGAFEVREMHDSVIRDFGYKDAKGILRRTLRQAAKPLLDRIILRTPVDTGALRDSVKITSSTKTPTVFVGWRVRGRGALSIALSPEFGNTKQKEPAQPPLRTAAAELGREVIDSYAAFLATQIEKTARRNARRAKSAPKNRRKI